jgi:hypothetical protein
VKKKLLSLVAAVALTAGIGAGVMATPAGAQSIVTGCQMVSGPPGSNCTFIGVGTIGTYQLTITGGGRATLAIDCYYFGSWVRRATPSVTGTLVPGVNSGNYTRPLLTQDCRATLTVTSGTATATFT